MSDASKGDQPVLRVVHGGEPTDDQLAALVTALAVVARASASEPAPARSAWVDRAGAMRSPVRVGPGAWRSSGRTPGARTRAGW